ncbi:MAG: response regulator [Anaerolineales bacterium]|nr:response regulator [Anaerolineales bacterium]
MPNPIRILLVDDEPLILRSMQKTLLRAGYEVETAASCSAGWQVFEEAQRNDLNFNLAILDINMPGFEGVSPGAGLELLSRLLQKQPGLPVIMLTAYDDVGKAKEAVSRGARNYLVKGREQGLVEMIRQILSA